MASKGSLRKSLRPAERKRDREKEKGGGQRARTIEIEKGTTGRTGRESDGENGEDGKKYSRIREGRLTPAE